MNMARIAIETSGPEATDELNSVLDRLNISDDQIELADTTVEDGRITGLKAHVETTPEDIADMDSSVEQVATDGGTTVSVTTQTNTGPTAGHTHTRPHTGQNLAEELLEFIDNFDGNPTANDAYDRILAKGVNQISTQLWRLHRRGYVAKVAGEGKVGSPFCWGLTIEGQQALREYRRGTTRIPVLVRPDN